MMRTLFLKSRGASKGHNGAGYCAFRSELEYNINMEEETDRESE